MGSTPRNAESGLPPAAASSEGSRTHGRPAGGLDGGVPHGRPRAVEEEAERGGLPRAGGFDGRCRGVVREADATIDELLDEVVVHPLRDQDLLLRVGLRGGLLLVRARTVPRRASGRPTRRPVAGPMARGRPLLPPSSRRSTPRQGGSTRGPPAPVLPCVAPVPPPRPRSRNSTCAAVRAPTPDSRVERGRPGRRTPRRRRRCQTMSGAVRRIRPEDIDDVHAMIRELATYERSLDEVKGSADDLRRALTAPEPMLFGHVAEAPDGAGLAGFALWYVTYSTWEGQHGLYLEDLFVRPEHRGTGLGKGLLAALAEEATRPRLPPRGVVGARLERACAGVLPQPRRVRDGRVDRLPPDRGRPHAASPIRRRDRS